MCINTRLHKTKTKQKCSTQSMMKQGIQNTKAILKFSSLVPVLDNVKSDINLITTNAVLHANT